MRPSGDVEHSADHVWGFEFIAPAGLRNLEHVNLEHRGRGFQTPHAGTLERGAEAQSKRVALSDGPGNVNPNRNRRRSDRIVLASELERVDWDGQVEAPALAGREPQAGQIEAMSSRQISHETVG